MSDITIVIEAPGLTAALHALASALSGGAGQGVNGSIAELAVNAQRTQPQPAVLGQAAAQTFPGFQLGQAPDPMAPVPGAVPTGVPTAAQTYSLEQLAVASTQLVDAGRVGEVLSILAAFGVQALTDLPREHYGAYATQLRATGVKI